MTTQRSDTDSFADTRTPGEGSSTSPGAKEQAKQTAGAAADETKHVANVAASEAQRVAEHAKTQVQQLLGEATSQMEDQSRTQKDRLVGTLHTISDDLERMTGASDGIASELIQEVADRARTLTYTLEGREPRELLDDLRSFARRKPGTFLFGALAAGIVAGRLTRGAKEAQANELNGSPMAKPSRALSSSTDSEYRRRPVGDTERVDPLADPLTDPLTRRPSAQSAAADPSDRERQ